VERVRTAFAEIVKLALSLGGTIAAEHGVGTLKRAFVSEEIGPSELGAMETIRAALDPDRRLNPGKKL